MDQQILTSTQLLAALETKLADAKRLSGCAELEPIRERQRLAALACEDHRTQIAAFKLRGVVPAVLTDSEKAQALRNHYEQHKLLPPNLKKGRGGGGKGGAGAPGPSRWHPAV